MSPKLSRPTGDSAEPTEPTEPTEPDLPPGHVPMRPPARPARERRKPISLWWKVGAYVVLLAATVGTVIYLGQPDDPRSSAKGTAELVAKSLTDGDIDAFRSYLCHPDLLGSPDNWTNAGTTTVSVTEEGDEDATASVWSSGFNSLDLTMVLRDRDGSWCVAAIA
jgi:hypothetical protein